MKTRRNSYGETVKQKRKLDSDSNPKKKKAVRPKRERKLLHSSSSSSSSKMTSMLSSEQDKFMLRYLHAGATGSIAVGESYSYNWWTRLAETLSSEFGTSVGTDACIRSSRSHEALYMQYYQKSRNRLTHLTMNPDEYQKILHDVYRKDKRRVLTHPSGSVGSMRASGSRSRGPMSGSGSGGPIRRSGSGGLIRASRNFDCNTAHCHPDHHWCDWEEKVTPLLEDLYNKRLLTSQEVDAIARHFKFADTRVGINIFLNMNLDTTRAMYVKDTLAKQA